MTGPDFVTLSLEEHNRLVELANKNFILSAYQSFTPTTAIYPDSGTGSKNEFAYLGLGLASEAGEVAGKLKKYLRDNELHHAELISELGDCLWYISQLTNALGVSMEELFKKNMVKLSDRKERKVIGGSGDDR